MLLKIMCIINTSEIENTFYLIENMQFKNNSNYITNATSWITLSHIDI
jgi:hypothetical protein